MKRLFMLTLAILMTTLVLTACMGSNDDENTNDMDMVPNDVDPNYVDPDDDMDIDMDNDNDTDMDTDMDDDDDIPDTGVMPNEDVTPDNLTPDMDK